MIVWHPPWTRGSLFRSVWGNSPFGSPLFSPISLFANNEQGAWYDPSDLTTLYQDSAGTTPVAEDGDPVGLMLDKSGNGNDASQSVSSARMLFSGGYLVPDGVDDNIDIPLGSGFIGDCAIILDTGPIFGSIDTKTDGQWQYTKNAAYIPDGGIRAILVLDRAFTEQEKQQIIGFYSDSIISAPSTAASAFRARTDLTELDISHSDYGQVTNATLAFYGCSSLTAPPDVSGWTQVTNAGSTFRSCSSLTTPPDVSGWTQVTNASYVFSGCSSLITPPDVSGWTQVTNAGSTFRSCSSLTSALNLVNWNPVILTDAALMMFGISSAGFDNAAYDSALIAWDTNYDLSTANIISAHFGSAQYTAGGAAEAARTQLVNAGWTITDGGPV